MHQKYINNSIDRSQGTQLKSKGIIDQELFSVKEVCEATGLNRKKLFDYQNIVKPSGYDKSGYKLYSSKDISKLIIVAELRNIGASLASIKEVIDGAKTKQELIAEQIEALEEQRRMVEQKIKAAKRLLSD